MSSRPPAQNDLVHEQHVDEISARFAAPAAPPRRSRFTGLSSDEESSHWERSSSSSGGIVFESSPKKRPPNEEEAVASSSQGSPDRKSAEKKVNFCTDSL